MTKKVILDCDPGHDDAVAILLAVGNPTIDLLGVTTVGGNQSLEKVTYNARAVLQQAGATDVPVHAGCDRPLVQPQEVAASIHGETGLDGVELPVPTRPLEPGHAVNWIIETVMNNEPGTVTIVPTGPLTNIAMAARMEPRIVSRVKEVALMGGAVHGGNWSATAEFNIKADPEAAHIVFNEQWPLTMVGIDLTQQALCTPEIQQRIEEVGTETARFVSGLMTFFRESSYKNDPVFTNPPIHDPCPMAYVIDPTVMTARRCPLDVELRGDLTVGMTVADLRGLESSEEECNTQVAQQLDFEKFWGLIIDALERIG